MPLLQKGVAAVAGRMPKVVSPQGHAVVDFCRIGAWALLARMFWRSNKRASLCAMFCGGVDLGSVLMTDMPGGVAPVLSFPTHLKFDMGLAALAGTLPNLMGFGRRWEASCFRLLGLKITAVAALSEESGSSRKRHRAA